MIALINLSVFVLLTLQETGVPQTTTATAPSVTLTYPATVADTFTGSVYLMFTDHPRRRPTSGPDWFTPKPFFRQDVVDWKPDQTLVFGPETTGIPGPLGQLPAGHWRMQAVMRTDPDSASIAGGQAVLSEIISVNDDTLWPISMTLDDAREARQLRAIEGSAMLSHRSQLLSDFHGRDIQMRGVAFFPKDFDAQADRNWPVLYVIGGFPGGLEQAPMARMMWGGSDGNPDFVIIYLEAECGTGHHAFADSANNGPWGQALVSEFIPWIESTYPLVSSDDGRFLTGHSSGGWSSLWLQVTYPDFFGGTWSTAPDPVDFRAFQEIDIYAPQANAYRLPDGSRVPVIRGDKDEPSVFLEDFIAMEQVIGEGGQLRSFEWVFSPRDESGQPRPLFDRTTGAIDPDVAQAWKAYDISLILEENWEQLEPMLAGKIHVYMGDQDTFYLEDAAKLLQARLAAMNADAVVKIVPGDHSSILFGPVLGQIKKGLRERLHKTRLTR